MSEGTPRYTVRLGDELLALVEETIARRNANSPNPPWDLSGFIRCAILEKLMKMERSRSRVGRRSRRTSPATRSSRAIDDEIVGQVGNQLDALDQLAGEMVEAARREDRAAQDRGQLRPDG